MKKNKEVKLKKEFVGVMLTPTQEQTVKSMIMISMEPAFTDRNGNPDLNLLGAANEIADEIIKNVQMALTQDYTFAKSVNKTGKKVNKVEKKITKKVTKK